MGLLQQSLGIVDLVLHQIQLCASLHRPAGTTLPLIGHQFPLDRLAGSSDLALVVDDGPAQLKRIPLSRAICPGLVQEVSTSLRWDPVCFSSSVLRFCGTGGVVVVESFTRWIVLTSQNQASPFFLGILCVWHSGPNGNLGTHVQPRQQDSEVDGTWRLRFESNDCERAGVCCCDVCGVLRCRPVAYRLSKILLCPSRGFASHPLMARYHQSSFRCCPKNLTVVLLRSLRS